MSKNSLKQNLECLLEWKKELKSNIVKVKRKKGTRLDQYKKQGVV